MRSFLAVELDEPARGVCAGVIERLAAELHGVRWVAAPLLHVTLRFLGDLDERAATEVGPVVAKAIVDLEPFPATLDRVGSFPPRGAARVIWIGVGGGAEAFQELARKVNGALADWGLPPENRRFTPHVTIGRARRRPVAAGPLETFVFPDTSFEIGAVTLFESELSRRGPSYTALARCPLGGALPETDQR